MSKLPLILSFFIFAHAILGVTAVAAPGDAAAVINGKEISKEDFQRRYKENIQIFKFTPPTKANVLNDIINFELAVQEAKRQGIDKKPEVMERINAVLYQSLIEEELSDKFKKVVDVSDKEARDFCRRNPAVRTSHVYVALKPAALKAEEEAAYKKIKEAQAAIAGGMQFEQVVAKYSEGYATGSGGDIGFQSKDKLDPTYYMEARKLRPGAITNQPIRSQFGLHIIKLSSIQDCATINIPEWQRMVFDEKRAKIFEEYLGGLRSKAKVSINQEAIKE